MDATSGHDNDTTKSPSPPDVMSNSTNISSQSRTKLTDLGSRQATSRPTVQGRPSYAAIARKAISNERLDSAASDSPGSASSRQPQTKEARPADIRSTSIPAAVPRDRQATAQRRDISELDVKHDAQSRAGQPPANADNTRNVAHPTSSPMAPDISTSKEAHAAKREGSFPPSRDTQPSLALRGTGSNITLRLPEPGERKEKNVTSLHELDASRERNATRPRAQEVDWTASVQPSAQPSTSSPPLNRLSSSISPQPSPPVPSLTETTSSLVHAARSMPPNGSQARSGRTPLELPHDRDEERRKAPPDEQSRTNHNHSTTPRRPPSSPDEHVPAATEPPSQSVPVSAPRRLDKSNSRHELTSDKKEQKGVATPEEYETRAEDSTTSSDGTKRRKAGLNPPTSYTPNVIQGTNTSVGRTYSSNSSGNDSMGKSRGKADPPSDSTPPLIKQTLFTPAPPSSVSTQSQPKNVIRVSSNSGAIVSMVEPEPHRSRPPKVTDSQIESTPSIGTSFNQGRDESLQSQVQPGPLTRTELREDKAMEALEGRYPSEPFIGYSTFSPSSVKQRRALNNNEGKLQLGGLNQILVAEKLSSNTGTSTSAVEIQQGAGPTQLSPPDDGNHENGPQGSSGEGRPPGRGEPPGGGSPPEQLGRPEPAQLSLPDDESRGEGPRASSGEGRPPEGDRPPEQLGRREPTQPSLSDGGRSGEGPQGSSRGGGPSGRGGPPEGGGPPGRSDPLDSGAPLRSRHMEEGPQESTSLWTRLKRLCCCCCC
ncbi:hypothetical protein DFH94DRAFT_759052 [Russula ochroleuca]|uniref:Uncharacterized protein n=1 Tax=Russula ochroleuca TaxID=152965 RepID=A0A9P5T678_9AGAM|nr:hypothetical protein DFH94DRAFT_759052 [Russula ochroleuca]